jgi:hypothetical protein
VATRSLDAAEESANPCVPARREPVWRRAALHPLVVGLGYALVSGLALMWGTALGGFRVFRHEGLVVCHGLPRWAFGRGGTTLGGVYLTDTAISRRVLEHESVHRAQWRRYGLALIPLYVAAGRDPHHNRFEIAAGLDLGGYS